MHDSCNVNPDREVLRPLSTQLLSVLFTCRYLLVCPAFNPLPSWTMPVVDENVVTWVERVALKHSQFSPAGNLGSSLGYKYIDSRSISTSQFVSSTHQKDTPTATSTVTTVTTSSREHN
jgi:hypothetical protein